MNFLVNLTASAAKDYKKLPEKDKLIVKNKINILAEFGLKTPNIKSLKGRYFGLFRLRAGNYRIIFDSEGNIITIISILNRKEAYKS